MNQAQCASHAQTAPSVSFVTMGCAKNEVDTDAMSRALSRAGFAIAADPADSDVVVVNTCSFIQAATEESIEAVLAAADLENVASGRARLVVAGCLPARYGDDLAAEVPEAAAFLPCADEGSIVEVVRSLVGAPGHASARPDKPASPSVYVKISDGCNRFCSFCTIPFIRGRYRSFPYADIAAEVANAVSRGAREIVLIAQDTGRWGSDFDEPSSLAKLIGRLAKAFPHTWLRVMYVQPDQVTDELIEAVAAHPNVVRYFDIPFQHASAHILASMGRAGDAASHLSLVRKIRERMPDAAIRTTLMTGFPRETDEDFEALCAFVEEAELDYVGVFAYSREDGTRAARMEGQVDEDEKQERASRLRDIADAVCAPRVARRCGSVVDVLVCGVDEDGQLVGRARCQAPEVDGVTFVDRGEPGQVVRVQVEDALLYDMEGRVVS